MSFFSLFNIQPPDRTAPAAPAGRHRMPPKPAGDKAGLAPMGAGDELQQEIESVSGEPPTPSPATPPGDGGGAKSVFLSPQSLLQFPVASAFVVGVWKLWDLAVPSLKGNVLALIIIALGTAVLISIFSLSDPKFKWTKRLWFQVPASVILNGLCLAMAALGVGYTAPGTPGGGG